MPRQIGRNIVIDAWNISQAGRDRYEQEVSSILIVDLLNVSQVGRIVVEAIQAVNNRRMKIQPWTAHDSNAEAVPLDWRGSVARGEPLRDARGRAIANAGFGSGIGTSTVVRYNPSRWLPDVSSVFPSMPRPTVRNDRAEVLLHEVCHGLRQMLGLETGRRMPNGLENDEEFFAILVTNIHSSQRSRPLGGSHGAGELRQPDSWLTDPVFRATIQRFRRQMPNFTARMAQVGAHFNPFRDIPIEIE